MTSKLSVVACILASLLYSGIVRAVPIGAPGTPRAPAPAANGAEQAVDAGYQALNKKDLQSARAAFADAAKRFPDSALPHLGLAEVARLESRVADAEQSIRRAIAVDPKYAPALSALGRLQFTQGKFTEAEATFKKAMSLDPASPSLRIDLAENYLNGLKRYDAAADAYRAAIKLKPDHAGAHMGLAAALAQQGNIAGAAGEYRIAAKYDPDSPLPWHRLGLMYARHGQRDEALQAMDAALEVAHRQKAVYVAGLLDRGDLHLTANAAGKAAADYRAAVAAEPQNALALVKLGTALQVQQKWDDAERAYLAAIQADGRAFAAYNNLAWMAAARKEKLNEALQWSRKAVEIAPEQAALYDTLAAVHRARGEAQPAIAAWEKAVSIKPTAPVYLYRLGVAYADAGRSRDAVDALKRSLKSGGAFAEAADARRRLQQLGEPVK
jgi:tetratricopeptide (TPR) repeat protein